MDKNMHNISKSNKEGKNGENKKDFITYKSGNMYGNANDGTGNNTI